MIRKTLFPLGVGALGMYLFDPFLGRARRAHLRDRSLHELRDAGLLAARGVRDLQHRAVGVVATLQSLARSEAVEDEVLAARVKSRLGHLVTHPHAIDVAVEDGVVVLVGPVLAREAIGLLATVRAIPGVRGLENRLLVRDAAENLPSLQGSGKLRPRSRLLGVARSPSGWLLGTTTLELMVLRGLPRMGLVSTALQSLGVGLLALVVGRRLTNNRSLGRTAMEKHGVKRTPAATKSGAQATERATRATTQQIVPATDATPLPPQT